MRRPFLPHRTQCASILSAVAVGGLTIGALAQTAPYDKVTNTRSEVVNFNPEPFTGLAVESATAIWAVNPYASTVVRLLTTQTAPSLVVETGLNPVSIGLWADPAAGNVLRLLVASTGTHGLFLHSTTTGEVLGFLRMDSEPADLVIDQDNGRAFVSCQGTNTVVQVRLSNFTIEQKYTLTCGTRAGSMFLDRGATALDHRLYVVPALTGNNSIPLRPNLGLNFGPSNASSLPMQATGSILDVENSTTPLPDHDVFRIDPNYASPGSGTVVPVLRRAGSLLFDLARNPDGDELWVLSTDSLNKTTDLLGNPDNDTEPELRGRFAINQLVRVPGLTSATVLGGILPASYGVTDLDQVAGTYSSTRSVNQARTLVFMGGTGANRGDAFVASAQSDVIVRLDKNGNRLADLVLPPRSQCFSLAKRPGDGFLAALCLGSMTVEVFNLTTGTRMPGLARSIGLDPTPAQVRRGRDVFLDGQLSEDGRFSCASCHPRGMTDALVWGLRGDPNDVKDIMVTQSLFSIADTFPHHWRGERDLDDFKKAFGGLLGASEGRPTQDEMDDLVAFFQSLQAPANPIQNPRRVIDDTRGTRTLPSGSDLPPGLSALLPPLVATSSATRGQDVFSEEVSFNEKTCLQCHSFESGSDSSHMTEGFLVRAPRAMPIEMAHLRQMQLRGRDSFLVETDLPLVGSVAIPVNRNGAGFLHDGREPTLLHFLANNFVDLDTPQMRVDAFRFVEQFDQGISPATHWGQRYVVDTGGVIPIQIETNIKEILIDGAIRGWNDVVAFGRSDPDDGGTAFGMVPMRWFFDASLNRFVSDSPSVAPITWAQMKTKTRSGFSKNVFVGVPPGTGRGYGIDHDRDGLLNGQEVLVALGGTGTDPFRANTDGGSGLDPWPDGYELAHGNDPLVPQANSNDVTAPSLLSATFDFRTSRLAKYHVRFDEAVTYTVTYSTTGGPTRTFTREDFVMDDTFVITHDEPSTPAGVPGVGAAHLNTFDVFVQAFDRNGNPLSPTSPGLAIAPFDADDVHFPDFSAVSGGAPSELVNLHVGELQRVGPVGRFGDSMSLTLRVKADYNYDSPGFGAKPASDRMVFGSLSVKRLGTPDFVKINTTPNALGVAFSTTRPTGFAINRPVTATVEQYTLAPGGDWICSPHTNTSEEASFSFIVNGLQSGDIVRYSVMGILTPVIPGAVGTYTEQSLQELQPLTREDAMQHDEIF